MPPTPLRSVGKVRRERDGSIRSDFRKRASAVHALTDHDDASSCPFCPFACLQCLCPRFQGVEGTGTSSTDSTLKTGQTPDQQVGPEVRQKRGSAGGIGTKEPQKDISFNTADQTLSSSIAVCLSVSRSFFMFKSLLLL